MGLRGESTGWLRALLWLSIALASASAHATQWTKMPHTTPWPGFAGWTRIHYDSLKHRVLIFALETGSNSAYATTMWQYLPPQNAFTRLGGAVNSLGQPIMTSTCPAAITANGQPSADDTPTWPGPRDTNGQFTWDGVRNGLWLVGGDCGGAYVYQDTYFFDSASDTWHQLAPAHFSTGSYKALTHDPDDDVLFMFGSDTSGQNTDNSVYCPTDRNPVPGMLTAAQSAAGCAAGDDWTTLTSVGAVQPPGVYQSSIVWDPIIRKVILYGGVDPYNGAVLNQTWAYDVETQTWKNLKPRWSPPAAKWREPSIAYDPRRGTVLYHHWNGDESPSDWSYDPIGNLWTQVGDTGFSGPPDGPLQPIIVDPDDDLIVGWTDAAGGDIWLGAPDDFNRRPIYTVGCNCQVTDESGAFPSVAMILAALLKRKPPARAGTLLDGWNPGGNPVGARL